MPEPIENENALRHLLRNEGIDRSVFDFIRHNLGTRAAYLAVAAAELPHRRAEPTTGGTPCS